MSLGSGSYADCADHDGDGDLSVGRGAAGDAGWGCMRSGRLGGVEEVATGALEWLGGFCHTNGIPTARLCAGVAAGHAGVAARLCGRAASLRAEARDVIAATADAARLEDVAGREWGAASGRPTPPRRDCARQRAVMESPTRYGDPNSWTAQPQWRDRVDRRHGDAKEIARRTSTRARKSWRSKAQTSAEDTALPPTGRAASAASAETDAGHGRTKSAGRAPRQMAAERHPTEGGRAAAPRGVRQEDRPRKRETRHAEPDPRPPPQARPGGREQPTDEDVTDEDRAEPERTPPEPPTDTRHNQSRQDARPREACRSTGNWWGPWLVAVCRRRETSYPRHVRRFRASESGRVGLRRDEEADLEFAQRHAISDVCVLVEDLGDFSNWVAHRVAESGKSCFARTTCADLERRPDADGV